MDIFNDDGMVSGNTGEFDLNGDGFVDAQQVDLDLNGDGFVDAQQIDLDLNGDGIADVSSFVADLDGDGFIDLAADKLDLDGDGYADIGGTDVDLNGDGIADISFGLDYNTGHIYNDTLQTDPSQQANFNYDTFNEYYEVHGTPQQDIALWDQQDAPMSCACATTNMLFRSVGIDVGEDVIADIFNDQGIYDPVHGTNPHEIDDVINEISDRAGLNIKAVEVNDFDINDLQWMLDHGIRPLVGVDGSELYDSSLTFRELFNIPDAGHAVQVTGIIHSPEGDFVTINDPGFASGAGQVIPLDQFMDAAADCNFTAIAVC